MKLVLAVAPGYGALGSSLFVTALAWLDGKTSGKGFAPEVKGIKAYGVLEVRGLSTPWVAQLLLPVRLLPCLPGDLVMPIPDP